MDIARNSNIPSIIRFHPSKDVANYVGKSVEVIQRVYAHHSPGHLEHLASLDRRAR